MYPRSRTERSLLALLALWLGGCEGLWVDEGDLCPPGRTRLYADADEDGRGDATHPLGCAVPEAQAYATTGDDCDDDEATVYPGASERCDGLDNDCDGDIDEELAELYGDADGDGYGDPAWALGCTVPTDQDFTLDSSDCDDRDSSVWPGAPEQCDSLDNDCDGQTDEDLSDFYLDTDQDGHGDPAGAQGCDCPEETSCVTTSSDIDDCDDDDDDVYPGAAEVCDELDNDCDGETDEGLQRHHADLDEDGHGDPAADLGCTTPTEGGSVGEDAPLDDCDDLEAAVYPGATETCDDLDNDCDGETDEDLPSYYEDKDGDGHGDPAAALGCYDSDLYPVSELGTDCDDGDPARYPGFSEVCDGLDNDCDSAIDEDLPSYYLDLDEDGHGDPITSQGCTLPAEPWVEGEDAADDCDDDRDAVYPGAAETCDDLDNDCDGDTDEDLPTWYADRDGDGFGDEDLPVGCAESDTTPSVTDHTDCDDLEAEASPAGVEICDGLDNDCEGTADEGAEDASAWYPDQDGDGVGQDEAPLVACLADGLYSALDAGDCDDENPYFAIDCPWVDLGVSSLGTCGLRSDGSVECWGLDLDGELTPPDDGDDDDYVDIDLADLGACGVHRTGALECWGGLAGLEPAGTSFTTVHLSTVDGCAVNAAGEVVCFGLGFVGGLPDSSSAFVEAYAGDGFGCGLTTEGDAECWSGYEDPPISGVSDVAEVVVEQATDTVCVRYSSGELGCWDYDGEVTLEDVGRKYDDLAMRDVVIYGLYYNGQVEIWYADGALIDMVSTGDPDLERVEGDSHFCTLDRYGQARCDRGLLGGVLEVPSAQFEALSASGDATCGARDGAVYCWGEADPAPEFRAEIQTLDCGSLCVTTRSNGAPYAVLVDADGGQAQLATANFLAYGYDSLAFVDAQYARTNTLNLCLLGGSGDLVCEHYLSESGVEDDDYLLASDLVSFDVGTNAICAIDASGYLYCGGDVASALSAEPALTYEAMQVSLGRDAGWVLLATGRAQCWGACADGAGRAYGTYTCSGFGASRRCQSSQPYIKLATHVYSTDDEEWTCGLSTTGAVDCFYSNYSRPNFSRSSFSNIGFSDIFAVGDRLCALHRSGAVECCEGDGDCEVLDLDAFTPALTSEVVAVGQDASSGVMCALDDDGVLGCDTPLRPFAPSGDDLVLTAGVDHLCALDGQTLICAGDELENQSAMQSSHFGELITALAAGGWHSLLILEDGTPVAWGLDDYGQATLPDSLDYAAQITAGTRHSCAIDASGDAVCWGDDGAGQSTPPAEATAGDTFAIAAGGDHTCALVDAVSWDGELVGEAVCWGDDGDGQSSPPAYTDLTAIYAGPFHTCALRDDVDEPVVCWGRDGDGQVSDAAMIPFVSMALGDEHTCGLSSAGTVRCWGRNREGQTDVPALSD